MKDDHESSPLHWAIEKDAAKSVEFLLQHGADPADCNNGGYAALHLAVQKNALESLKVLLQFKVRLHLIYCYCYRLTKKTKENFTDKLLEKTKN